MFRLSMSVALLSVLSLLGSGCAPIGEPPKAEPLVLPKVKISVSPEELEGSVAKVLKHVNDRELLTTHSFWTVIHGILGNGIDAEIRDPFTRKNVKAVEYIRQGGAVRGMKFIITPDGVDVRIGPVFDGQGHQDQFVAEMAQIGMPLESAFLIDGRTYNFSDFLRYTKANAQVKGVQELSWTLVALSQYYGTDFSWTNKFGEELHFTDLVQYELNQPVNSAACGGTHRLFGLTWAYFIHMRDGGKMNKLWSDVAAHLKKHQDIAKKYRNQDGSFSTDYLQSLSNAGDVDRRIGTTGHLVEWLALSLPDEELRKPWMRHAVASLIKMILENESMLLDAGSLYHASHGLRIYYDRVYGRDEADSKTALVPPPPKLDRIGANFN